MEVAPQLIRELINQYAIRDNLRPEIIACVIIQESAGNTFANRFEPGFFQAHLSGKKRNELAGWKPSPGDIPNLATELNNRSTSWGLMQVMGDTARWCAKVTNPYLTSLCDPDQGISAGCRVLSYYLAKNNNDYFKALTCYNAGYPNSPIGKEYAKSINDRFNRKEHLRYLKDA